MKKSTSKLIIGSSSDLKKKCNCSATYFFSFSLIASVLTSVANTILSSGVFVCFIIRSLNAFKTSIKREKELFDKKIDKNFYLNRIYLNYFCFLHFISICLFLQKIKIMPFKQSVFDRCPHERMAHKNVRRRLLRWSQDENAFDLFICLERQKFQPERGRRETLGGHSHSDVRRLELHSLGDGFVALA